MNNKALKTFAVAIGAIAILGTSAIAGTTYKDYCMTVQACNKSAYTGFQTKELNGNNGKVKSKYVGGNYKMDVRMQEGTKGDCGNWTRNISDGTEKEVEARGNMKKGDKVRLEFSSDFTQIVDVQIEGQWKSN